MENLQITKQRAQILKVGQAEDLCVCAVPALRFMEENLSVTVLHPTAELFIIAGAKAPTPILKGDTFPGIPAAIPNSKAAGQSIIPPNMKEIHP